MGTEVLRPHDCLVERIRVPAAAVFPRRGSFHGNNYHSASQIAKQIRSKPDPARSDPQKKISGSESKRTIPRRYSSDDITQTRKNNIQQKRLLIGQVTILRRGDPVDLKSQAVKAVKSGDRSDLFLSGTERIGPDPAMVPKQIRIRDPNIGYRSRSLSPTPVAGAVPDVYAGSAFFVSPAPESLPLPSFTKKKQVPPTVDDSATRDLRRLLRLD